MEQWQFSLKGPNISIQARAIRLPDNTGSGEWGSKPNHACLLDRKLAVEPRPAGHDPHAKHTFQEDIGRVADRQRGADFRANGIFSSP